MGKADPKQLPHMLFADQEGRIYDHPFYRMAAFSGDRYFRLGEGNLVEMPEFSKLFFFPHCPPVGLNPSTGRHEVVHATRVDGKRRRIFAVAAFLEPGFVRSALPAVDYGPKRYVLPSWAYTAVGFRGGRYWAAGFRIEYNKKWDPRNYDDRELVPAMARFREHAPVGRLTEHLSTCAVHHHCFAAKNLFLGRWEAPLPVSRYCNAACLGCLSLQPDSSCEASHQRISFTPSKEEVVRLAVGHIERAPEPIVSFGQGCEGEPLTEYRLIRESILAIRERTGRGTINLNTNGSFPDRIRGLAESGLDSIRISLNSARASHYRAYYRPKGYDFEDVVESIRVSREMGLYTMINYLVFPGLTDEEDEMEAFARLVRATGANFVHFKNLCIDPRLYLDRMPGPRGKVVGMKGVVSYLRETFPDLELGYFNRPVR
ncbi:MAG: radical SAM protein [Deltaproteobacteria bacterium]|nr:MAG: radical SAM protein [Deltaproteobacteria bacterium]